jgi:glutaredoxin
MFEIYSKDGCPYCEKIKIVMQNKNLPHVVLSLNNEFDKDTFYGMFGKGSTFPQVVYNGVNLGGCVDTVKYLRENNIV